MEIKQHTKRNINKPIDKKIRNNNNNINWMYIPALILFMIFVIYPLLNGIRISFTDWNGYSQDYNYIGFENYKRLVTDKILWRAFFNTIVYGFGSTLVQNVLGLAYAIFLNTKFRGHNLIRTVIYMPVMVSSLIMGYILYFVVQYDGGALNDIMMLFGKEAVDWMGEGNRAVLIVTLFNSLQFVGISMVIYMAGLQNISKSYYEAAQLDGANSWNQFKNITLPLLTPAITSSVILNLIGGLKLFDIIKALTNGGPGTASHSLSTLISQTYFGRQLAGYSSTIGLFTFGFIMLVSIIAMKYFDKKEVYS